ncbi:MAG: RadC family protein [Huintestinicola sp.]
MKRKNDATEVITENTAAEESRKDTEDKAQKKPSYYGHRERVRKRFLKTGFEGFAPHEVMELLLFYAIQRQDTKPLAHELISRFGSVSGVLRADVEELCSVKGISMNTAVFLKAVSAVGGVCAYESRQGESYTNSRMLCELFKGEFEGVCPETFLIAGFDNSARLLGISRISEAKGNSVEISSRKVLGCIMQSGCVMAAIAHNHPGSSPVPSDNDIRLTRRINELFRAADVKLLDHIIIAGVNSYSMRDNGDLKMRD